MIAGFQSWANNIYNRVRRVHEVVRVPENSGLTVRQQRGCTCKRASVHGSSGCVL